MGEDNVIANMTCFCIVGIEGGSCKLIYPARGTVEGWGGGGGGSAGGGALVS